MPRSILTYANTLFAICLTATAAIAGEAFDASLPVARPAAAVSWSDVNPAIRFGDAFGDRATGPHGTLGTFQAHFQTPLHRHSGAYHAVVIEGVMTNPFGIDGDGDPPRMGPGSYWYVPAGMPHATACVSETPCKFYMHAEGAFDFIPIE